MKFSKIYLLLLLSSVVLFHSCKKQDVSPEPMNNTNAIAAERKPGGFAENDMVMYWNDKTNIVLAAPMNQPTRSRYFAMIEIAVHDALNSIKPKFQRFALLNERKQFASPDAAVAAAAYWSIKGLNRQGSFPLDTWYSESLLTIPDGESKEQGKELGKKAAEAIIAMRSNDGFLQVLASSVNPPNGTTAGAYRQTNLLNLRFVPNWGTVLQTYATLSNTQFRPSGPYALTSANYAADYNEVKEKGARTGSTRTAAEEQLALFWGDNKPSFHWNNFARAVVENKKMDAWKTARLFAAMHTAIAEGFNTVLESKYHYYFWRPETAIREGNNDGNETTVADAGWLPFVTETPNPNPMLTFISPPIPEYPSAFSLVGGATAEVLKTLLGTDKIAVDITSPRLAGVTLHYSSLAQAARDNSLAKIYAGWYFRKAVLDGEETGRQIATYVLNNSFQPAD